VSIFRGDASEVYALAGDFTAVNAKAVPVLREVMAAAGTALAAEWAKNAVETSGVHGKWYPKSIDSSLVPDLGGVSVDVGPNKAKKQGKMGRGFEFGSENQPPHLDGLRALDGFQLRAERMVDAAIGHLLP
jgi:hypothetical protein